MQRHRHQEFIRFLNRIEREVPADKAIHVFLDNYAAHKKDKVRAWLDRHPRWSQTHAAQAQAWRLPFRRRPSSRHQRLHPGIQRPRPQALRLESRSR